MTKPEPWELFRFLSKKYKYISLDERGVWRAFNVKPSFREDDWYANDNSHNFSSYFFPLLDLNFNKKNWKESLYCRDDYADQLGEKPVIDENIDICDYIQGGTISAENFKKVSGSFNKKSTVAENATGESNDSIIFLCKKCESENGLKIWDMMCKISELEELVGNRDPRNKTPFQYETWKDDCIYNRGRIKVFGGWIYREEIETGQASMVFIPDPNHEWEVE